MSGTLCGTYKCYRVATKYVGAAKSQILQTPGPQSPPSTLSPLHKMMKSAILFGLVACAVAAPTHHEVIKRGNLPTPVSAATARSYLSSIPTEAENNSPAYDRDLFNHWITISGNCNTRETVLQRDGSNVVTDSACASTSGSWYSDYDGATWTAASDVDIDHLVPLREAWVSGARNWDNARRQQFANE